MKTSLRRLLLAFALLIALLVTAYGFGTAGGSPSANAKALALVPVTDVPLPGSSSRLDYQSLDAQSHRLYIAHLDASQVIVFDTMTQQVAHGLDMQALMATAALLRRAAGDAG